MDIAIRFCKIIEVAAEVRQRTVRVTAALPRPTRNRKSILRRKSGGGDEDDDENKNKEGGSRDGNGGDERKLDQGSNTFELRVSFAKLQQLFSEIPRGLEEFV